MEAATKVVMTAVKASGMEMATAKGRLKVYRDKNRGIVRHGCVV
jgi:tRNA threonylcarbamoyladenosine modification (KEOPS) complex  Pcc1 subunit